MIMTHGQQRAAPDGAFGEARQEPPADGSARRRAQRAPMREIVIVGGGFGGLGLARALRAAGAPCRVRILERSPEPPPDRFGITLAPNGLRALEAMGVLGEVVEKGCMLDAIEVVRSGRTSGARLEFACLKQRTPYAVGILPRALQAVLEQGIGPDAEVLYGHEVLDLVFRDGRVREIVTRSPAGQHRFPAHVVVGADGVRSSVRKYVASDAVVRPVDEAYQIVLGGPVRGVRSVQQHIAPGRLLGLVPVASDRTFIFWLTRRNEAAAVRQQPIERFRAMLSRHAPVVEEPLSSLRDWRDVFSTSITLTHSRRWYARGVALLGDTLHATTPSLAQGANMALVDAVCLAEALARWCASPDDTPDSHLRRYQDARRAQATFQYYLGQLVVRSSIATSPLLARCKLGSLEAMSRNPMSRRLLLETITGLRPLAYDPSGGVA
ncbi:NAD(P)/FAD-dependent oxidoreductase [Sorangium sp. So ce260]|uniref:FAD-dependent oxidoreductase n=1 Tax=Sorangium sp. So ce260 TaxID=3133291 RepID=UPI003F5DC808